MITCAFSYCVLAMCFAIGCTCMLARAYDRYVGHADAALDAHVRSLVLECLCVLALLCKLVYMRVHVRAASCTLAGYVGDRGAALTSRSSLAFRWAIVMDGKIHESEIHVRADHASERGVPFPAAWRKELLVVNVDALADAACRRAREELSLSEDARLACRQQCA